MPCKKIQYSGTLEADKPFYVDGCDITVANAEQVYKCPILWFFKDYPLKIKDICIKAVQLSNTDFLFFGERTADGQTEIYELTEKYRIKLSKEFTRYLMHCSVEKRIKHHLSFLFADYEFKLAVHELGNAVDKNGKFFFYGPVQAYCIYNTDVCINLLILVQRQDYDIYITDEYRPDQVYIRNGMHDESGDAYNFSALADHLKRSIAERGEIYGHKLSCLPHGE